MRNPFAPGDQKHFRRKVTEADLARFEADLVHPVLSTFALSRDAEWVCRLFVLDMKEVGEEGIGTFVEVKHLGPALLGQEVEFIATLESVDRASVICTFEAKVGERLIARGRQGQMILPIQKIEGIFEAARS